MSQFTLPSGRAIETHEPKWGAVLHALGQQNEGMEAFAYAKCAAVVSLTADEIAELNKDDGLALMVEVNALFNGRPVEQEAPFAQQSPLASAVVE